MKYKGPGRVIVRFLSLLPVRLYSSVLFWCACVWYHLSLHCFLASHFPIYTSLSEDISLRLNRWTVHILSVNELIGYHEENRINKKNRKWPALLFHLLLSSLPRSHAGVLCATL